MTEGNSPTPKDKGRGLRAYAWIFLAAGVLFVAGEGLLLRWIEIAGALVGAPALAPGGPSLWLGLTGSLMATLAYLAFRVSRAPDSSAAWNALMLSKTVSSILFFVFAARTRNPVFTGAAAVDGGIMLHLLVLRAGREKERPALAPRCSGAPSYEVFFARLNDPSTGRALWVRRSVTARLEGLSAAGWAVFFDASEKRVVSRTWTEDPGSGGAFFPDRLEGSGPGVSWRLDWKSLGCPPFAMVPAWLRALGLSNGYVSAVPAARFEGSARLDGAEWKFAPGFGSVGHVWGERFGRGWAWAHAVLEPEGSPTVIEALSARGPLGMRLTSLCVWRGGKLRSATGPLALLLNSSRRDGDSWSFSARAEDLIVEGTCSLGPSERLEYEDPEGRRLVCRNSKTSSMILRIRDGLATEELKTGAAAMEFVGP